MQSDTKWVRTRRAAFWIALFSCLLVLGGHSVHLAAAADPLTVSTSITVQGEPHENGIVWLGGLLLEENGAADVVSLLWVRDATGWFPYWELRVRAKSGLLDPRYIDSKDSDYEWITLERVLINYPLKQDQLYSTRLSIDPAERKLSYEYADASAGTVHAGTVNLQAEPSVAPPVPGSVTERYPYVRQLSVASGYTPLGPPIGMQRRFSFQLTDFGEDGQLRQRLIGYRFDERNWPGLVLTWPEEQLPGEVRIQLLLDGKRYELGSRSWSPGAQDVPFVRDGLPYGEGELEMLYVEDGHEWVVARTRFAYVRAVVDVGLESAVRDDVGNVQLTVRFATENDLTRVPIELEIAYQSSAEGGEQRSWVRPEQIEFLERKQVTLQYTLPAPADAGTIIILPRSPEEGIFMRRGEISASVEEAPPFRMVVQHARMTQALGEPAFIRLGDSYPTIKLDTLGWPGKIKAQLVRDGEVVASLPAVDVTPGAAVEVAFPEKPERRGYYEIRLAYEREGRSTVYHAVHFRVADPDEDEGTIRQIAFLGPDGRLEYAPDYLGNRIPDYSHAGYRGGGVPIPDVPVVRVLEPVPGDNTARIQAAINELAAMPLDENGFRGAILLKRGTYEIAGTLHIQTSGIVLRGEGDGEDGTILVATGNRSRDLISVSGPIGTVVLTSTARRITDLYVPVGARSFHVETTEGLKVGDTVVVRRYGNAAWISEIGMDQLPPMVGDRVIYQWSPFHLDMERVIVDITGDLITVDAPIVQAIDPKWGGGEVIRIEDRRIENIGVEYLRAVSEYDKSVICDDIGTAYECDEEHAQYLVIFSNVKNSWARGLTAINFAHGITSVYETAKWLTIEDTQTLAPISQITGSRRYPWHVRGQMILVQRAFSEKARHTYAMNKHVTGPNVFLYARSVEDYAYSEPHRLWAAGGLYDNVHGRIAIQDRWTHGSGHGWSGAYFTLWNTEGPAIVQSPPTAINWSIGHVGVRQAGTFAPRPQGYWHAHGRHVEPESLYLQQLHDRLGPEAVRSIGYPDWGR